MTAASLYHHFPNKQDILRVVMTTIMQDVLTTTRDALLRSGAEPSEQLAGLVAAWVEFHANRRVEARVGASELPYLDDEGRRLVVALRDQQEQMFVSVVNRGVQEGVFATAQPREAARAIVNMGTAVASWFRDDGTVTAQDLAQLYARFALSLVGWKGGGEEGIDSGLAH
jgi:AcrR family transcriptional regulator